MHRQIVLAVALTIVWYFAAEPMAKEASKISREMIEAMFADIRSKTDWNIDGVCLWGYFFTDPDRQKLRQAGRTLERQGYRYVAILEPTAEDDDKTTLFLHVERSERHTVDTLLARNEQLYEFARKNNLRSYDGMDVGPLPIGKCM